MHRHVDHERLTGAGERRPIEPVLVARALTGREDECLVDAAHGRRHRSRYQRREPGGDPRNDAEGDAGAGERQRFLAAAPEHERIAALEAEHAAARARELDQPFADVGLLR